MVRDSWKGQNGLIFLEPDYGEFRLVVSKATLGAP